MLEQYRNYPAANLEGKCFKIGPLKNPCANVWKRSFPPTICTRDALYLIDCQNRATGARCRPKANDTKEELVVRGGRNKKRSEVKRGGREWKHEWFGPLLK